MTLTDSEREMEMFKLEVLSSVGSARHYTWIAVFTGAFVAYWSYLLVYVRDLGTFFWALVLGGAVVAVAVTVFIYIPLHSYMERISEYLEQVRRGDRLSPLIELYESDKSLWRWWRTRKQRTAIERSSGKRGLGFFLLLAVTLWFTGFFAWSQTVLWQSALSDIAKSSSGSETAVVAGEGMGETLIVSALFAVYLWVVYRVSGPFREVFDGLFGLRRGENRTTKPVT